METQASELSGYRPPGPGQPPKYDYGKWLNGKVWRLWKATEKDSLNKPINGDFNCSVDTMKNNIRHAANRAGLQVSIFHENYEDYQGTGQFRQAIVVVPKNIMDKHRVSAKEDDNTFHYEGEVSQSSEDS